MCWGTFSCALRLEKVIEAGKTKTLDLLVRQGNRQITFDGAKKTGRR